MRELRDLPGAFPGAFCRAARRRPQQPRRSRPQAGHHSQAISMGGA